MAELWELLTKLALTPFQMSFRLAFVYLAATVVLAFIVWRVRGRPGTFLSWLLPREVYRHKSNWVDIKIFLTIRVLGLLGLFQAAIFTPVVTYLILNTLVDLGGGAYEPQPITFWRVLIATLLIVIAYDFVKYWFHRLHHESEILWPFHSVHHSAEVLTPLTTTRNHPMFMLLRMLANSLIVGGMQALLLFAVIGKISILTISGANIFYVAFYLLGVNFRHSHIWISYGPFWERIFISPAQHQIHHSLEVRHHNKNYGEVFAFWDWMFGTLYIPNGHETLEFGIADEQGRRIEQPHPTLTAAMFGPFRDSWRAMRTALKRTDAQPMPAEPREEHQ